MSLLDNANLTECVPKITDMQCRGFAVLAWTTSNNKNKDVDVELAQAFADILSAVVNGGFDTVADYVAYELEIKETAKN